MKLRNPFKPNYTAKIAAAFSIFAKVKEELLTANSEIEDKVNKNTSKISKLNTVNSGLKSMAESNTSIIESVDTIIKKGV